jgi:hypothetical protein
MWTNPGQIEYKIIMQIATKRTSEKKDRHFKLKLLYIFNKVQWNDHKVEKFISAQSWEILLIGFSPGLISKDQVQ